MKNLKTPIALAIACMLGNSASYAAYAAQTSEQPSEQAPDKPALSVLAGENDIEVITVKGDFRQGNLQNIASAVSVLTAQDIARRNAQNLEELIGATANVNFASGSQRARYYQIRGIGERSQFNEPINPSVGLIIDDVDFSGIGSVASTFDIAQTEIFRGPQGTRFGATALAGVINIISNAPSNEFEGAFKLSAGNYDSVGAGLMLSGPATDKVNYRLAAEKYQSDGFIENTYLDREDSNNRDELSLRGKLAISATEHLSIDVNLMHFNFNNGYDAFSLDNTRQTLSDQPGVDEQETTGFSTKFNYTGLNGMDLVAIVSAADSRLTYGYDEDWSFVGIRPDWEYSSTDYYLRDKDLLTGELRAQSSRGHEIFAGTTAWTTGVYIKHEQEDLLRQYTYLDEDFNSEFDTETLAVFGQIDSQLNQQTSLIAGLRVEHRQADYENSNGARFDPSDTMVGGKLVLTYQYDNDTLIYGSINRGYKAGGANTHGSLRSALRAFSPEYLVNFELGYKVSLFDDRAYLRTAIFYMDRKDVQVKINTEVVHDDASTEFIGFIDNAATGSNHGLEIEGAWQLTPSLELYGALGLLQTKFSGLLDEDGKVVPDRDQAHAPSYQFNLGLNYYPSDNWLVNLAVDGKDAFFFSDSHLQQSKSVELLHGSVTYMSEHWQVKLWARNIFDKDYANRGFYFGNDPRDDYQAKSYTQLAEPAVFGATLDYQF